MDGEGPLGKRAPYWLDFHTCMYMYMYMQHITYHSYIVVLKARHLGGSVFCRLGMPEQALGGIPLGFGNVVEDF